MTRKRIDSHSTEFGLWLREQKEIDSSLGFVATNIDYIWHNYRTGHWMLIEEKRHNSQLTYSQLGVFKIIDAACRQDLNYGGLHIIRFEQTSPDDGRIYLDGLEITAKQLISFLRLEFDKVI